LLMPWYAYAGPTSRSWPRTRRVWRRFKKWARKIVAGYVN